jgi:hypothetical protein
LNRHIHLDLPGPRSTTGHWFQSSIVQTISLLGENTKEEFRSSGVQEFRSSGVQEFRSSGVQEFRSGVAPEIASAKVLWTENVKATQYAR